MNEVDRSRDGRREADAVVGAVDVVVHCLGDRDDRIALVVQPQRERQRVVAADRQHRLDSETLEHLHRVRRVVADGLACLPGPVLGASQELRLVGGPDPRGVGPRRVQEGAAASVDRSDDAGVERHDVAPDRLRVVRVRLEQARPPAADPDDLVAFLHGADRCRLDAGVQPGHVAPTGQDPDPHPPPLERLELPRRLV
jgi:hypothetical protein